MATEPRDWIVWRDAAPTTYAPPRRLATAADLNGELRDQIAEMAHQIVRSAGQMVYADGARSLAALDTRAAAGLVRHSGVADTDPHLVGGFADDLADASVTAAMWGAGEYRDALGKTLTADKFAANALKPAAGTVGEEAIAAGAFTAAKLDIAALESILRGQLSEGNVDDELQALLLGAGGASIFAPGATYSATLNSYNELNTEVSGITVGLPGTTGNDITLAVNPFTEGVVILGGQSYSLADADLPRSLSINGRAVGTYIGQRTTPPTVIPGVTREEQATEQTFSRTGTVTDAWTAPVTTITPVGNDVTLIDRTGTITDRWTAPVVEVSSANTDVTLLDRSGIVESTWTPPVTEESSVGSDVTLIDRTGSIVSTWTPPVVNSAQSDVTLFNRSGTARATWTPPVSRRVTQATSVFDRSGIAGALWTPPVTTPGTPSRTATVFRRSGAARFFWTTSVIYRDRWLPDTRTPSDTPSSSTTHSYWNESGSFTIGGAGGGARLNDEVTTPAYLAARSAALTTAARLRALGSYQSVTVEVSPPRAPAFKGSSGGQLATTPWSVRITATTAGTASTTTPGFWAWDAASYARYTSAAAAARSAARTGDRTIATAPALPTSDPANPGTPQGQAVPWRVRVVRTTATTQTTPGSWSVDTAAYNSALAAYNAVSVSGYTNVRRTVTPPATPGDSPASAATRTLTWQLRIIATTTTQTTTPGFWTHGSRSAYDAAVAAAAALVVTSYTNVRRTTTAPVLPSADPTNPASTQTSSTTWRVRVVATSTSTTSTTTPGFWTHGSQATYNAAVSAAAALDVSDYTNVRRTNTPPSLPSGAPSAPATARTVRSTWRVRVVAISTTTRSVTTPGYWTYGSTSAYDNIVAVMAAFDVGAYTNVRRTDTLPAAPTDSPASDTTRTRTWTVRLIARSTAQVSTTTPGYWTYGSTAAYNAALLAAAPFAGSLDATPPVPASGDGGATNTTRTSTWTVTKTRTFTRVVLIDGGTVVPGTTQNVTLQLAFTLTLTLTFAVGSSITASLRRQAVPAAIDRTLNPANVATTYAMPLQGLYVAGGDWPLDYGQFYGDNGKIYTLQVSDAGVFSASEVA